MEKETEDILHEFEEMVKLGQSYWAHQQRHLEDSWLFLSGVQYTTNEINERKQNNRPDLKVLNVVRPRLNRVLNPFKASPNGLFIKHKNGGIQNAYNKLFAEIQEGSKATEAYNTAFENLVVGGVGYFGITTDYANNETLNQVIKIEKIDNSNSVFIDPSDRSNTGENARWAYVIEFVSNETIEQLYGEEYECKKTHWANGYFKHISIPEETTPVCKLYQKEKALVKRWFFKDGSFIDGKKPDLETIGSRNVELTWINVYTIIGSKVVSQTRMECDRIPIIRAVGDTNNDGSNTRWVGLVEASRTPQWMANKYLNSEAEMVDNAPLSPFVATKEQVMGVEEYWANANKRAYGTLFYNSVNGQGSPQRADNTANIQPAIMGRQQAMSDLDQTTGIYQNQMGDTSGLDGESGESIRLRNSIGEIQWKHYYQNMNEAMVSALDVIIQLIPSIYDYELDLDGEVVNFSEIKLSKYTTEAVIGAVNESQKERNIKNLMVLTSLLPEDRKTAFVDIIAGMIESDKKSIIEERIQKLVPADLMGKTDSEMPPEAQQALETAMQASQELQNQNDLMKQYITQLQNQVIELENDSRSMLLKAQMDNETRLQLEQMKQEGLNQRQVADMIAEANKRQEENIKALIADLKKPEALVEYNPQSIKTDLEGKQF